MDNLARTRVKNRSLDVFKRILVVCVLSAGLIGCGGGDGDGPIIVGTGITAEGTITVNRNLASNDLIIKAKTGEITSTPIAANSQYRTTTVAGDGPYLMRADLGNNDFVYGLGYADANGLVLQNVNSYSDLVVRNWFAVERVDLDASFNSAGPIADLPTRAQSDAIAQSFQGTLSSVLDDYGLAGVDVLTEPYLADNTGVDLFLQNNPVFINNGSITIIINDPNSGTQSVATSNLPLNTDIAAADVEAPSTPDNVRVLPAGQTEIVVVWAPSSDNVGVREYEIFRDDDQVATTPFPVFRDTGVTADTVYSYAIVAVDAAGNESSASMLVTAQTSAFSDTTPPGTSLAVVVTSTNGAVSLSWQHSDIGDVVSFNILRGEDGSTPDLLTSTTSTFATDIEAVSGTEYCYQIVAVDASGNQSTPTTVNCISTTGVVVSGPSPVPVPVPNPGVVLPPGSGNIIIFMATPVRQVLESSGSVTIAVNRVGDASEAVSIGYNLVDGTATAGVDYSTAQGILRWTSGDVSPKSIVVQIASDSVQETAETFDVVLTNVSPNASIGDVSTTTVTITDVPAAMCTTELETTTIRTSTILDLPCYLVPRDINVVDDANLTIAAGVTLKFAAGTRIFVNTNASLTAEGTAASPIVFTGQELSVGYWDGLQYSFSSSVRNSLKYVTIEYAGSVRNGDANLHLRGTFSTPPRISASNVTLRHSAGAGFNFDDGAILTDFSNNTVTANESTGILSAVTAGGLSSTNRFTGNTSDFVTIRRGTISDTTVWSSLDVPWLADDLRVSAQWTVDAGTKVVFFSGARVYVDSRGSLKAAGTESAPVIFTGEFELPGYWDGIQYYFSTNPLNSLEHVIIEYAGSASNGDANLYVRGNTGNPTRLSISNLTLKDSIGYGFNFEAGMTLSLFENVVSTGNNSSGIVSTTTVAKLGANSNFTGNTNNQIEVRAGVVTGPQTWQTVDVPYAIGGLLRIDDPLILSAGSTFLMGFGSEISVSADASLTVVGTASAPITFTGAQQVAGYWKGLLFNNTLSPANVFDHAVIEHGGSGTPATSANIKMRCNSSRQTLLSVSNTQINSSGSWGVYMDANGCNLTLGSGVTFSGNPSGNTNVQ